MVDVVNNYSRMPLTGKSNRKLEDTAVTVLAVPYLMEENSVEGGQVEKKNNRINDQVKSGKRRGAMVLSAKHGILVASGSKEGDIWHSVQFESEAIKPV